MEPLPGNWSICVASVFEDAVDQLSILGSIVPSQRKSKNTYQQIADEITEILTEQKKLESEFDESAISDTTRTIKQLTTDLIAQKCGTDEKQLDGQDNLNKINRDRQFAEDTLRACLEEVKSKGTFDSLMVSVADEIERKSRYKLAQEREVAARKELRHLQRQLGQTKKAKDLEVHEMTEMIAHLKDQLQEMKSKSNLESKYVKKSAVNSLDMNSTLKRVEETDLGDKLEQVKKEIEMENRTHTDVINFLHKKRKYLGEKVEYWMEKFEVDTEAKSAELTQLKADKEKDFRTLQELARTYDDYERVVIDDRMIKQKKKEKEERQVLEEQTSVRLQAWWRGTMVRRGLGPWCKEEKKGKKGKKGGKKGGGKKGKKKGK